MKVSTSLPFLSSFSVALPLLDCQRLIVLPLKCGSEGDENLKKEIYLRKALLSAPRCRQRKLKLYLSPAVSKCDHVVSAVVLTFITRFNFG
jgi:hypothetical protein